MLIDGWATKASHISYTQVPLRGYDSIYGTVSAKIAPWLKCYKNASRLNRYNFPTDNAIDFLFSTLRPTPFHYEVLKEVDSVIRWEVIAIQTRCIFITF